MELKSENIQWLLELSKKFNNKDIVELRTDLLETLDLLIFLNEALVDENVIVDDHEVSLEPLVMKFFLHGQSIAKISEGYSLSSSYFNNEIFHANEFIDISSLLTILRAQLECLLMYQHIYVNPTNKSEEELRYNAWIYSALLQRQNITATKEESKSQKLKDLVYILDLKNKIQQSESFLNLTPKQQSSLIESGSGKLFKHWGTIFRESNFTEEGILSQLYYLLSVYSHSEGLSVIQLKSAKYDLHSKSNSELVCLQLESSLIMSCCMIINITNRFPAIAKRYESIDEKNRYTIYFLSKLSKAK